MIPTTKTDHWAIRFSLWVLFATLLGSLLISCDSPVETIYESPVGRHSIHTLVIDDVLQYDTLRYHYNVESSYLILSENGKGKVKFYSNDIIDYSFDWSTISESSIYIHSGELAGTWNLNPEMRFMNLSNCPKRTTISFNRK
jgi:hypothetical protein